MSFLRNLGHDLVDKKLWPLAVILVAALVAVPVLLGGGGGQVVSSVPAPTGPAGAAPTASAASAPATAQIAAVVEEPTLRRRGGKVRDPFKQQFKAKSVVETAKAQTKATTKNSGGSAPKPQDAASPVSTGDVGTGTPRGGAAPKKAEPKLDPLDVYRVTLRFGEPGGQKTMRDIARLSPLPNADRPFFVFLGVLSGGKKAVFLVSSDATATGDGDCRPSKTTCETVELEPGETQFFDLETENGTTQYQLDLVSVRRRTSTQAVAARRASAARKRAAAKQRQEATKAAERDAKDDEADELGTDAYRWDAGRGVLVRRPVEDDSATSPLHLPTGLADAMRAAGDELATVTDGTWQPATP